MCDVGELSSRRVQWQHFGADPYASSRERSNADARKCVQQARPSETGREASRGSDTEAGRKGPTRERRQAISDDVERRHRPSQCHVPSRSRPLAAAWSMRHRRKSGRSRGGRSTSLFSLKSVTTGARLPARLSRSAWSLSSTHRSKRHVRWGIGTTIGPLLQTNATHNGKATDCGRRGMGNVTFAFPLIGHSWHSRGFGWYS